MKNHLQEQKLFPVYGTYLLLLGQSAWAKLSAGGVPPWFEKQFSGTVLNAFPGALAVNFYGIAVAEFSLTLGFLYSLIRGEGKTGQPKPALRTSLYCASLLFAALSFGARLTGDFSTAAQLFVYAMTSFALNEFARVLLEPGGL